MEMVVQELGLFGLVAKQTYKHDVHIADWFVHAKSLQSYLTVCNPMGYSPPGSIIPGDSPGKNTGVRSHALLQGIFLVQ